MGGGGKGSAPAAPDYGSLIQLQSAYNLQAAQQQSQMNRVNQVTPYGTLTYSGDPTQGGTATTTLSPAEQANLNATLQAQQTYGQIENQQLGQAASSLSQPINTNYDQYRNQYIQSQMGLIQPQINQQMQALQSTLQNQGVAQGSDAWNNAMRAQTQNQNQMYADILANAQTGVGQDIQQQIALRDQPLNEAQALMSGSQVQQPNFVSTPQSTVQPTNVLGAVQTQLQQQDFAYQQQVAQQSSMLGGLGSIAGQLGAAAIMGSYSDRRIKTDEREVGKLMLPGGDLPIKTFRFQGDPVRRMGFVAQDVEKVHPEAAFTHPITGIKGVNYAQVLMAAHQHAMGGDKPMGAFNGNGSRNGNGRMAA